MNVLSLFDGMSCGQIALDRLGVKVNQYFAAEIDKYAMQVAKKNYPNTQHIGNVLDVKGEDLPKIDLLIGGSPCQGFSFAGKQLNFDDPRSKLFFEFVRLLDETKPTYFLLENVRMKKEYQDIISEHLGVEPVMINSALVSAQNRVRLYWTNIPGLEQPNDKGIVLKDILEDGLLEDFNSGAQKTGGKHVNMLNTRYKSQANTIHDKEGKAPTICAGTHGYALGHIQRPCELKDFNKDSTCHHVATATDIKGNESIKRVYAETGKSPTLTTMGGGHREPKVLCVPEATKKGYTEIQDGDCFDATFPTSKTRRGRNMKDKCNCLTAANYDYMRYEHPTYRKLTPMECERLQTVPDGYTEGVSNTQRYKMLGNGWTVDVICHVLKNIRAEFARKVA